MKYLRDYQRAPVDRLLERGNLLCALDTGGGKTIISIAAAEELLELGRIKRVLIICPANLKSQWAEKLAEFTDLPSTVKKLSGTSITIAAEPGCVVIDGTPARRKKLYTVAERAEYVIVGYDAPLLEPSCIRRLNAEMIILDEASAIKTFAARRSKNYKRDLMVPYRLALTATPVENRPDELYSIMQWVDPDVLGRWDFFDAAYIERNKYTNAVEGYKNLDVLNKKVEPAMFRLSADDAELAQHLPAQQKLTWHAELTEDERVVYRMVARLLYDELCSLPAGAARDLGAYYAGRRVKDSGLSGAGRVMAKHQALEMFLDHPCLLAWSATRYEDTHGAEGSEFAHDMAGIHDLESMASSKSARLVYEVGKIWLNDPRAKVIIFSQYKHMLDLLEFELDVEASVYTGDLSTRAKAAAVARFRQDPECNLLLSSHAGAYGTDVPEARWLINYDLPWSHGKAHQINGRNRRVSSTFDSINTVNLLVSGTIEERKAYQVGQKSDVAGAIIDGTGNGHIPNVVTSLKQWLAEELGID
jgi:SNF2 family DNA or RNA helicase